MPIPNNSYHLHSSPICAAIKTTTNKYIFLLLKKWKFTINPNENLYLLYEDIISSFYTFNISARYCTHKIIISSVMWLHEIFSINPKKWKYIHTQRFFPSNIILNQCKEPTSQFHIKYSLSIRLSGQFISDLIWNKWEVQYMKLSVRNIGKCGIEKRFCILFVLYVV